MKEGRIRTIAQGSSVKDAIHEVSASRTASHSKPFSIEDVKESTRSAISTEAAGMIRIPDRSTGWSQTRGLRLKEEGLQKTALAAVLVNKSRLPRKKNSKRKSQECQKTHDRQRRLRSFSCKVYKATPFYISMKKVL